MGRLGTLYDYKSLSNKIFLNERLFGFNMDQSKPMGQKIDQIKMIDVQLANLDKKIDEEYIILLNVLPKTYNKLKTAIKYDRKELKHDFVIHH